MNDKTKIRTSATTDPEAGAEFIPERRLDELGADSIDMVELLVVIDSDFGVRLKQDEFLRLVTDRSAEHAL